VPPPVVICHALLLVPVDQQSWSVVLGWMRQAANPFPVLGGKQRPILGVLDRALAQGPQVLDSTARILAILPNDKKFIRRVPSRHMLGQPTTLYTIRISHRRRVLSCAPLPRKSLLAITSLFDTLVNEFHISTWPTGFPARGVPAIASRTLQKGGYGE
jgi:hypothetical protein